MLFQSKDQGLVGNPCQETGDRTGKATTISMVNLCLSKSPQVMEELLFLTMLLQLAGPLARHSVELNSTSNHLLLRSMQAATWKNPMFFYLYCH